MARKRQQEPLPPDPRQKVRIFRDGLHKIAEFYIEPDRKVIDVDVYITLPTTVEVDAFVNNPAERIKDPE